MKVNLFISYYKDKTEERQRELDFCVNKNINAGFDSIQVLVSSQDVIVSDKLILHVGYERPTFNDFFEIMSIPEFSNDINILANTDIFFQDLQQIRNYGLDDKTCLALSRWDYSEDGNAILFDRADSQDTWIFYGSPKIRTSIDFHAGEAGCDNRLAYELQQSGCNVTNPSKSIKTYHYHNSNIRYWNQGQYPTVPPPYLLIQPS